MIVDAMMCSANSHHVCTGHDVLKRRQDGGGWHGAAAALSCNSVGFVLYTEGPVSEGAVGCQTQGLLPASDYTSKGGHRRGLQCEQFQSMTEPSSCMWPTRELQHSLADVSKERGC